MATTQRQRKADKAKHFARTRRGQPVMRHRLEQALAALQREAAGGGGGGKKK